jgi:hypothetical protein
MVDDHNEEDWLYHLPAFLDQIRETGAHGIIENLDSEVAGILYHHRGARVPGHNATFVWSGDTFELEVDAVGSRAAWAVFDADCEWDFYLSQAPGDAPCLAWMCDAEFRAEETETFDTKQEAVGLGRFSFGLYLQSPTDWPELEERTRETDVPCFIQRPSGRMLVPEGDLETYEDVVPPELLNRDHPDHLGLVDAHVSPG